ncbi:phosphonate ABC transporter, periplasmic phosphonate-binding protein [Desulfitobacterium hafniense DCB-2]|uniref:Phosphonate ABC transporter, periplasmic phosphonate-binding protein n=1 Tax=Desulfitobacterium hafniense (strain DSM 10664 / DCB-2) TaxID=272564 RepID=B8G146_DESHD|nr:phosphate/phosphite/phosphonate ABC transporter substrate-binding protein [Desulfitobacterium hafniense]ACL19261.1 phosphonate ABC transporter, periplasmic phosphonate-binding protein [Desulfitobacterium hafniense DCB-2]
MGIDEMKFMNPQNHGQCFLRFLLLIILSFSMLTGCSSQGEEAIDIDLANRSYNEARSNSPEISDAIYFGFDRRLETKEDVKMYVPLLNYLRKETGYRFEIHVTPVNSSVVEELGQGKIQMAAIGTLGYLQASETFGAIITVKGLNNEDKDMYKAAIVTRPNSQIKVISDIRGRSFAFGDLASTQGHLIPRIMLSQKGIEIISLKYYQNFASHSEVANAVMSGRFEAGGMQDTLAKSLEDAGLLKIIAVSEEYPSSGIAFAKGVDKDVIDKITQALVKFDPEGEDKAGLYHWERSEMPHGFTYANNEDYNVLRNWADKFGLLKKMDGESK